jgi:GDP-L-fucose synthase
MDQQSRIYVAGGRSLIGAALLRRLAEQGYANLCGGPAEEPDCSDAAAVADFFARHRPQYVFHAGGASGGIAANIRLPADLMLDNLQSSLHVIQAAHIGRVQKLLYLASSCCYPRLCPQPMREDSLLSGPLEPTNQAYALAKLAGMALCQAYRRQYGDDFIVGIPANAFGIEDDFSADDSHVIGALIGKMHEAKMQGREAVTLWGTGTPLREFVFADDLADACILVMRSYSDEAPINLGGGNEISIGDLAEMIRCVVGFSGKLAFDPSQPDGMPRKSLDASKMSQLGWRPRVSLLDALAQTYQSYLRSLESTRPRP